MDVDGEREGRREPEDEQITDCNFVPGSKNAVESLQLCKKTVFGRSLLQIQIATIREAALDIIAELHLCQVQSHPL